MKRLTLLVLPAFLLLATGCTRPAPQQIIVYPKVQADTSERKAGKAMLFYERAEEDADVHNVVVTPPEEKKE